MIASRLGFAEFFFQMNMEQMNMEYSRQQQYTIYPGIGFDIAAEYILLYACKCTSYVCMICDIFVSVTATNRNTH